MARHSITSWNYTKTYFQNLGGFLTLSLKKPKRNVKNFQKIGKICDIKKLKSYSLASKNLSATHYQTP